MHASEKTKNEVRKKRIAIILGKDIDHKAVPALKYLILHLNCLQSYFEYEFPPIFEDEFLDEISHGQEIKRQPFKKSLGAFMDRYKNYLENMRVSYKLQKTEGLPEYYIFLNMIKFDDQYYLTGIPRVGVIALGNWERLMAPPTLLEFILTTIGIESVYLLDGGEGLSHLGTKGCLFDFNPELNNARYNTLQSFICDNCRNELSGNYPGLCDQLVQVLEKKWMGNASDPSSPAGIIANFGYDLFYTKGITPTWKEYIMSTLRNEGIKELLKLIAAILLAAALFFLGLKK